MDELARQIVEVLIKDRAIGASCHKLAREMQKDPGEVLIEALQKATKLI